MSKETELSAILSHAAQAGLLPNTIHSWLPALTRYTESIIAADRELRRGDAKVAPAAVAEPVTDAEILEVCGDFAKDAIGQTNLIRIGRQLIAFSASRARLFRLGLSHGVNPS